MPYAWYSAWLPGYYQTCCAQSGRIWAQVIHRAHGRWFNNVQPYWSVFPGRWSYQMEQSCWKAMPQQYQPCKCKFQRVNPGLPEAVTRLSNVGDQLICWLCVAKKPAFMLIHEFMQHQTQLFSYLDNRYLHWKSKRIFLAHLKAHQYKFRDDQDCSATFAAPKVKNIITIMTWIHPIMRIHLSYFVSLFQMRNWMVWPIVIINKILLRIRKNV